MKNIKMIVIGVVGLCCVGLLIFNTISLMDPEYGATPTPEPSRKIGEVVTVGDLSFTVNSIEPFDAFNDPDPDMMFVNIHFNVENTGAKEEDFGDSPGVIRIKGDSKEYPYHHVAESSVPYAERLPDEVDSGQTVSGYVSYEIPDDSADIELIFKDKKRVFLSESSTALKGAYAETEKLMKDLAKTCAQQLNSDSATDEAATGILQILRIESSSSPPLAFMRPNLEGYAESSESFEVLGCYIINEQIVEKCEYKSETDFFTVELRRVKIDKTVLLIDPKEKKLLRKKQFEGGTPEACPSTVEMDNNVPVLPSQRGEVADDDDILEWVQENWTP